MCPTARERSRRVAVEEANTVLKGSQLLINYQNKSRTNPRAAVIPSSELRSPTKVSEGLRRVLIKCRRRRLENSARPLITDLRSYDGAPLDII
jgi:hypothetical protein